ncbi:unnamed protein product, partial [Porites evermanni]
MSIHVSKACKMVYIPSDRSGMPYRIQFKNLLPVYLKKFLSFKESASYHLLRSNTTYELNVLKTKCKTFGDRVFARVGPPLWNILRSVVISAYMPDIW